MTNTEIIKRFRETFSKYTQLDGAWYEYRVQEINSSIIENFLTTALEQQRKEIRDIVEKKKKQDLCKSCYEESQEVGGFNGDTYHERECEYNDALDDILQALEEK